MSMTPFDLTDDTLRALYMQCGESIPDTVELVEKLYEATGGTNCLLEGMTNLPIENTLPSTASSDYVARRAKEILARIARGRKEESDRAAGDGVEEDEAVAVLDVALGTVEKALHGRLDSPM